MSITEAPVPGRGQLRRGVALGFCCCVMSVPMVSFAGRPLVVDDAGTVAPGDFEFEAGFLRHGEDGMRHYEVPFGLTYGVVPTLEAGAGFGGQLEEREEVLGQRGTRTGLGDLTVGAKWNPIPEGRWTPAMAFALTAKIPTADHEDDFGSGEPDLDITWIGSKTLPAGFSGHVNVGYTWTGDSSRERYDDVFHSGGAVGVLATDAIELVAEIYAEVPLEHAEESILVFSGGARWNVVDSLVLDAAAGAALGDHGPEWLATAGFTWTFGLGSPR